MFASALRGAHRVRLPVLITVVGVLVVGALWFGLVHAQRGRLAQATRLTAEQVARRLVAWTDARTGVVRFLAGHGASSTDHHGAFRATARSLHALYPGFQALNLIDPRGTIVVVTPREGNEAALGRSVDAHPEAGVRAAFARARRSGDLETSSPIRLYQGGRGVPTYKAIRAEDGRTVGYVNGVFRVDTLVDTCLSEAPLRENYRFRLRGPDGAVVYEHGGAAAAGEAADEDEPWASGVVVALPLFDQAWSLEIAPSPAMIAASSTWTDDVLGLVGLALVAVMGLLLALHLRRLRDLAESRARYQLLVENVADLIVKVDRDGRFLYVSPSYCALFGKTEGELLGQTFMPLVHEDDRAETDRAFRQAFEPPYTAFVEQRALTARGWRWLAWSDTGVPSDDGRVEAVIGVGRDVTERKELEAQLRHSQKLHEVGELAGGVAHDFNNILQAMFGNLSFAREALPEDHPARQDLERVERGARRAARLTRQLLAFSRRDSLRARPIDPNRLIRDLLGMLGPALGGGVTVDFAPEPAVPAVHADPAAIEQVVTNLCVNARDATGGAGTVRIRTGVRFVDEPTAAAHPDASPGTWVVIEVADDGPGIDPALVPRIFEPFYTTKERGRGTGLGLSTVYGIVRQHEGFVDVDSTPGRGATFRVHLPRSARPAVEAARGDEAPPAAPPAAGGTILVAEDDELVRDFAVRALRRAGYDVVEATDGDGAVRSVAREGARIDLALLDVVMPGTGGYEAARRIRELQPALPIVFTSGYDPDAPAIRDNRLDGDDLLAKPYTLEALLEQIRATLSSRSGTGRSAPS